MIIDNTYFKCEIYIPHAKPSISDNVSKVDEEILLFISEYAENCLLECLGPQLLEDLKLNLDQNESSWVDALADDKWDRLVNGYEYTDPNTGLTVKWKGIRWKADFDTTNTYKSFLANYVYFFYERKSYTTRANNGIVKEESSNAESVSPIGKVVDSWNKFVNTVQGKYGNESIVIKEGAGVGIDYFTGGSEVCLYKFIEDMNAISENTYANFTPKKWSRLNKFDI